MPGLLATFAPALPWIAAGAAVWWLLKPEDTPPAVTPAEDLLSPDKASGDGVPTVWQEPDLKAETRRQRAIEEAQDFTRRLSAAMREATREANAIATTVTRTRRREASWGVSAAPPDGRRVLTTQDLATVFASGPLTRGEAVAALRKLTGCGRTAAYQALAPGSRFSEHISEDGTGQIAWASSDTSFR